MNKVISAMLEQVGVDHEVVGGELVVGGKVTDGVILSKALSGAGFSCVGTGGGILCEAQEPTDVTLLGILIDDEDFEVALVVGEDGGAFNPAKPIKFSDRRDNYLPREWEKGLNKIVAKLPTLVSLAKSKKIPTDTKELEELADKLHTELIEAAKIKLI